MRDFPQNHVSQELKNAVCAKNARRIATDFAQPADLQFFRAKKLHEIAGDLQNYFASYILHENFARNCLTCIKIV